MYSDIFGGTGKGGAQRKGGVKTSLKFDNEPSFSITSDWTTPINVAKSNSRTGFGYNATTKKHSELKSALDTHTYQAPPSESRSVSAF